MFAGPFSWPCVKNWCLQVSSSNINVENVICVDGVKYEYRFLNGKGE